MTGTLWLLGANSFAPASTRARKNASFIARITEPSDLVSAIPIEIVEDQRERLLAMLDVWWRGLVELLEEGRDEPVEKEHRAYARPSDPSSVFCVTKPLVVSLECIQTKRSLVASIDEFEARGLARRCWLRELELELRFPC